MGYLLVVNLCFVVIQVLRPADGRRGSGRRRPGPIGAGRSARRPPFGDAAPAKECPAFRRPRRLKALLVPVVGAREEGAGLSVGVELGDHVSGGPVGEGRGGPSLLRHHQPVGVPVPSHREEPLGAWGLLEPAQPHLEQVNRDGTVGQRQLLRDWSEPAHRARGDQDPRHEVGAPGLDVETPCAQHVVVADPLAAGEPGGVVDEVSHRARSCVSVIPFALRRPP